MKLIFACLLVLLSVSTMAQTRPNIDTEKALQTLKKLIAAQQFRDQSLPAPDTSNLMVGEAINVSFVPLDKLRAYKDGTPAKGLITDLNQVIIPVINRRTQAVVSTLTAELVKDKWTVSGFGADKTIAQTAVSLQGKRLVRILALKLDFIGVEEGGSFKLIPLQDDKERQLVIGRAVDASVVFKAYVQAANDYNGLPW